jgi:hypothetical protein
MLSSSSIVQVSVATKAVGESHLFHGKDPGKEHL